MKILIVDDDLEIRFALANVFQGKHKFAGVEASSGREAIATLSTQEFNLIISDFQMDNGNGDVIVDFLTNQQVDIPFIFLSGSPEIKTATFSLPVLKCFAKSEVKHLIEFVEMFYNQSSAQRAVVS